MVKCLSEDEIRTRVLFDGCCVMIAQPRDRIYCAVACLLIVTCASVQGYDGRHVRLTRQQCWPRHQTGGAESRESATETADPRQAASGRYRLVLVLLTTLPVGESGGSYVCAAIAQIKKELCSTCEVKGAAITRTQQTDLFSSCGDWKFLQFSLKII